MKRLILLGIFVTFLLVLPFHFAFAQDISDQQSTSGGQIELSPSTVPTATPSPRAQKVDYTLPYPGLLPDNPLYALKAIRDKVIEFLISDPVKKADFYLLSSDKRVNTGYYLIMKDKDDMGVLYISKSNNYMSMAESQALSAGSKGNETVQRIKTAIKKHEEVINQMESQVDKKNRTKLQHEIDRLEEMQSLIKKK